jgi:hypothetical protein
MKSHNLVGMDPLDTGVSLLISPATSSSVLNANFRKQLKGLLPQPRSRR